MAGVVTLLLRSVRWPPLAMTFAAGAAALLLLDHRTETVGMLALLLPFGAVWLVDDPASTLTASARWGRRPQLVVRCGVAAAVAAAAWTGAVAWAGGAPPYADVVLVALLTVALAAGVTWGAAYGGPAAAVVWAATTVVPARWAITGPRWWYVAAAGACWLYVAARDPVHR